MTDHSYQMTPKDGMKAAMVYTSEYDQAVAEGEHYWVAVLMWHVSPPFDLNPDGSFQVILDQENLRSNILISCAVCDAMLEDGNSTEPCGGLT